MMVRRSAATVVAPLALLAEVGDDADADQPDDHREKEERQRQHRVEEEGEDEQQADDDRLAEVDRQPAVQGVVQRLDVPGEEADGLAGPQGADGQRAQAEGVVVDGPPQPGGRLDGGAGGHFAVEHDEDHPHQPRTRAMRVSPTR